MSPKNSSPDHVPTEPSFPLCAATVGLYIAHEKRPSDRRRSVVVVLKIMSWLHLGPVERRPPLVIFIFVAVSLLLAQEYATRCITVHRPYIYRIRFFHFEIGTIARVNKAGFRCYGLSDFTRHRYQTIYYCRFGQVIKF